MVVHLSLTAFERLQLAAWIGRQRGDLALIRRGLGVLEKLELSIEEKAEVGYAENPAGASWKDAEHEWVVDLAAGEMELLAEASGDEWPVNRLILAMLEKLDQAT